MVGILILGSSGLLGRELFYSLSKNNTYNVFGTFNTNKFTDSDNLIKFSYNSSNDFVNLLDIIKDKQIGIIINSIVERNVDTCEKNWDRTYNLNVNLVESLIDLCYADHIKLIQISTDYVYDGHNPPYSPSSNPNPIQNYGITKLIAELRIKSRLQNYLILRVPVLYSTTQTKLDESSPIQNIKYALDLSQTKKIDNYNKRFPTNVTMVAKFINNNLENIGEFNLQADKYYTKYQMIQWACNTINVDSSRFIPFNDISKNRPINTCFSEECFVESTFLKDYLEILQKYKCLTINNDCFIMIDLDGTLMDSDLIHYECYKKSLTNNNVSIDLDENTFYKLINNNELDKYLLERVDEDTYHFVKKEKNKLMCYTKIIKFNKNADIFLNFLLDNNINFAVCTNTSRQIVQHFINIENNLLKKCRFICREDYNNPKPSSDCWTIAKDKYYKGEKHIIGIENTLSGYNSIKDIVDICYVYKSIPNIDIDTILFDDYSQILKNKVEIYNA